MATLAQVDYEQADDATLARLIAERDPVAVRLVTVRNNQRLFRIAWSILGNRAEAEDALQTAYLRAFSAIDRFEARAALSTWLTRIVINEALGMARAARRRRARLDQHSIVMIDEYRDKLMRGSTQGARPDAEIARRQLRAMIEEAIAGLPAAFRSVFVLREIEGCSIEEIAAALDIKPATVKTRLLRARHRLRQALAPDVAAALTGSFPFAGADCAALTDRVVTRFCRSG